MKMYWVGLRVGVREGVREEGGRGDRPQFDKWQVIVERI